MKRPISLIWLITLLIGPVSYAQNSGRVDYKSIQKSATGRPMPVLEFEHLIHNPESLGLSVKDTNGKVMILEFWATWCAPCIKQFPKLNELASEFEEDVTIISISPETEEIATPLLKRKPLKTTVALDTDKSVIRYFGVFAYPTTIIIGKDGQVIEYIRPQQLSRDYLRTLISDKASTTESATLPKTSSRPELSLMGLSGSRSDKKATDGKKPIYQVQIDEIEATPYANGSWGKRFGFLNVSGWSLKKAIGFAYDISEILVKGTDSLLNKQLAAQVRLPKNDIPTFDHLLKAGIKSKFGLNIDEKENRENVLVMTAPKGTNENLRPTLSENGHFSTDDGIIAAAKQSVKKLIPVLEEILKMKVIDETGLEERYDFNLFWDHENPESIREALSSQLGLNLRKEARLLKVIYVSKEEDQTK